ncbi:MAG: enhanced serine sensitivity protein SseB C-terminal domain-containing protein [Gammaproteobacteria bacterium]|nr:enhanced serine sensitivity protein SseB C-terminal domain-containing protein [Gammaproteobacteria bacterium]MDH5652483.1 enhanced serine sensitivity protein SseB C-terminal domain-containing protein [Gammaproteobacteria bacterium]
MFEPENELEESLIKASTDPAHRPQFYKDLAESDIFIIQHGEVPEQAGKKTLAPGMQLKIQNIEIDGKLYIPVFSSISRIQAVIDTEVGYLAFNALEFFEIVNGSELILNPGSEYGKEFTRNEVASIVNGTIWEPEHTYEVENETTVLIGQPKNYPHELAEALTAYFKTQQEVLSAYLAHFYNPATGDPPHTLVGILATENWNEIIASAGIIAKEVEIADPPVDFVRVDTEGGNLDYFHEIEPFYQKKNSGLFQ